MKLTKLLFAWVLISSSLWTHAQNLATSDVPNETMLFYLHCEAIDDLYTEFDEASEEEYLRLKDIFKPYLAHLYESDDMYDQYSWEFDGPLFQSFVLFDNFMYKNNNAGGNNKHLELPPISRYEEYLEDVFGEKQRRINHYHDLDYNYHSDKLPEESENNDLIPLNSSDLDYGQGLGDSDTSSSAIIGGYAYNGIVQKRIAIPSTGTYQLRVHAKGWWNEFNDNCQHCLGIGFRAYDADFNRLFVGDPYGMVPDGNPISSSNPTWNESLDMHSRNKGLNDLDYETVTDNPVDNDPNPTVNWKDKNLTEIFLSSEVKYIDLFFYTPYSVAQEENWRIGNTPVIALDDVYLGKGGSGINLIEDSGFSLSLETEDPEEEGMSFTAWEQCMFERALGSYYDDTGVLDALSEAYYELTDEHWIDLDTIDLFITIPNLDLSSGNSYLQDGGTAFVSDLHEYANSINEWYNEWLDRHDLSTSVFRIAGFHIPRETSEGDFSAIYFSKIKEVADAHSWHVIGFPYVRACSQGNALKSRYRGVDAGVSSMLELVSCINQQPNSFPVKRSSMTSQIVDHEVLKYATELMTLEGYGLHVEHLKDTEIGSQPYPRLTDYMDYARRYGSINYRKSYYESAGDLFNLAFSEYETQKTAYDDVYYGTLLTDNGVVLNSRFEHTTFSSNDEILADWSYSDNGGDILLDDCYINTLNLTEDSDWSLGHIGLDMNVQPTIIVNHRIPVNSEHEYFLSGYLDSDCDVEVSIHEYDSNGISLGIISVQLQAEYGDETFSFVLLDEETASVLLEVNHTDCGSTVYLDNITFVQVDSDLEWLEIDPLVWNQTVPLNVSDGRPAFTEDYLSIEEEEPLKIQYSARFQNMNVSSLSSQNYKLGIQFYDDDDEVLTDSEIIHCQTHELAYNVLPSTGVSSQKTLVLDTASNVYCLPFSQDYFGVDYTCVSGSGTSCEYLGCGAVTQDPSPSEPMDIWFTSQTKFNTIEILPSEIPEEAYSVRLFFFNTSQDTSEFIVHRTWMNNSDLPSDENRMSQDIGEDEIYTDSKGVEHAENLEGVTEETHMNIFPNPAAEICNIHWDLGNRSHLLEFRIFNSIGTPVKIVTTPSNQKELVLSTFEWSSGSYYLVVFADGKMLDVERFSILH